MGDKGAVARQLRVLQWQAAMAAAKVEGSGGGVRELPASQLPAAKPSPQPTVDSRLIGKETADWLNKPRFGYETGLGWWLVVSDLLRLDSRK